MTGGAAPVAVGVLAALAAGNPAARAAALVAPARTAGRATPSAAGDPPGRPAPATLAAALAVAGTILVAVAWAADRLLDALDVSPPSARLAAGLVLTAVALVQLVGPDPAPVPGARDRWAALVPLAFPHLLRPELALVVLSAGADHGGGAAAIVALVPLAALALVLAAVAGGRRGGGAPLLAPLCRLVAAVGILVGVDLVVDGIVAL